MIVARRRLFWKVYLTLLSSLVAVAVLIGGVWWLLGKTPREPWGKFRFHLTDTLVLGHDDRPAIIAGEVQRLGDEIGADVSAYANGGALIAASGSPILPALGEGSGEAELRHLVRIDLPNGRTLLVRLRSPDEPGLRILTVVLVVVGGVGLAAFPMTARLTRQLEGLRAGMARWGKGELSARVDEGGSDEVALVAHTFNTAADSLEGLLTSQKALLANASHELRSPLARLRIAIELWLEKPGGEFHAEIVRNLGEVDELVEELLLSSRLDHPSATVGRIERVDVLGLAAEEAVRVGADLEGTPVEIEGNAVLLRRLLRNLLENGTKHGRPPVHVAVTRHGQEARIIVSDGGTGIAPEERERVFEPFYRPAGRSEEGGGWGLGLSLVRQIAERHGGFAECQAEPNGGSRFVVHLAVRHVEQADTRIEPRHRALQAV